MDIHDTDEALDASTVGRYSPERVQLLEARIEEMAKWKQAVDEALVIAHLGTADSFESPMKAINALLKWSEDLGAYFALDHTGESDADEPCEWRVEDEDLALWNTGCGNAWVFAECSPAESNINFCPCCGKQAFIPSHSEAPQSAEGGE